MTPGTAGRPLVVVAGLGPAGPELVPEATLRAVAGAGRVFLRTTRHPAAAVVGGEATSFDGLYEHAGSFDDVYAGIVEALVAAAAGEQVGRGGYVAYCVPGSPFVAERTVALLRADGRVAVDVVPAPSFLDLAWDRLGVDPVAAGVQLVDAGDFAARAAGAPGPLLVAQCHSRALLSEVKLALDHPPPGPPVVVLHHLGLPDEQVRQVRWDELDRAVDPDHLTALWIADLAPPVAAELVRLEELVRVLRVGCPWDREQTHGSLGRHLLEEAYETLDAIEVLAAAEPEVPAPAIAHLEEELGDLLFQVVFHAALGAEAGRFTLADVARAVHDKLVRRHPHVFGDAVADTPEDVAARWEVLKKAEKGRASVTDGIPEALPALALAAKLQRKAEALHLEVPGPAARRAQVADGLERLAASTAHSERPGSSAPRSPARSGEALGATGPDVEAVGEMLFALSDLARRAGVDPESALRAYARRFRGHIASSE